MTYECSICHAVNHASRIHCNACGTIPARYSFTGKPVKLPSTWYPGASPRIEVLVAFGAERQVSRRTCKRTARTVPLDYYAEV